MMKPYTLHENEYRRMAEQGIQSWDQRPWGGSGINQEIDPHTLRALELVFSKPWMPTGGLALEIGCGTAPLLRWVCARGFDGCGIDISATAISMAREQSKDYPILFEVADICTLPDRPKQYDLIIDGRCLHCLTRDEDRLRYLTAARAMLRPAGVFVLLSMCGPVHPTGFAAHYPGQILRSGIIYNPMTGTERYEGILEVAGVRYLPTRQVGDWRRLLDEVCQVGFMLQHVTYDAARSEDPVGGLVAACVPDEPWAIRSQD